MQHLQIHLFLAGGSSVSSRTGACAMEWGVTAAACENANIAGDCTFAVSAAAAC